jgi:hypothetical protein
MAEIWRWESPFIWRGSHNILAAEAQTVVVVVRENSINLEFLASSGRCILEQASLKLVKHPFPMIEGSAAQVSDHLVR